MVNLGNRAWFSNRALSFVSSDTFPRCLFSWYNAGPLCKKCKLYCGVLAYACRKKVPRAGNACEGISWKVSADGGSHCAARPDIDCQHKDAGKTNMFVLET